MTFKSLIGALVLASVIALAATAGPSAVPGWIMAGSRPADYDSGVAQAGGPNRGPAAYLKGKKDSIDGFGTLMQQFAAEEFRGKRVRLAATVRTEDVRGWAGLWMRVDDETGKVLAFDNMQARPIKGTTGWQRHEVVLDVVPEAKLIAFGVLMGNSGTAWLSDVKFEAVQGSVPVTSQGKGMDSLPKGPRNLGFGES